MSAKSTNNYKDVDSILSAKIPETSSFTYKIKAKNLAFFGSILGLWTCVLPFIPSNKQSDELKFFAGAMAFSFGTVLLAVIFRLPRLLYFHLGFSFIRIGFFLLAWFALVIKSFGIGEVDGMGKYTTIEGCDRCEQMHHDTSNWFKFWTIITFCPIIDALYSSTIWKTLFSMMMESPYHSKWLSVELEKKSEKSIGKEEINQKWVNVLRRICTFENSIRCQSLMWILLCLSPVIYSREQMPLVQAIIAFVLCLPYMSVFFAQRLASPKLYWISFGYAIVRFGFWFILYLALIYGAFFEENKRTFPSSNWQGVSVHCSCGKQPDSTVSMMLLAFTIVPMFDFLYTKNLYKAYKMLLNDQSTQTTKKCYSGDDDCSIITTLECGASGNSSQDSSSMYHHESQHHQHQFEKQKHQQTRITIPQPISTINLNKPAV